jgi:DNA-binding IclR family transcriptional regulator
MAIKTTETVLGIADALKQTEEGLGVTELAAELDKAKSTIHDHLQTLEKYGFVVRDDDKYRLGLRFLDYGMLARNSSTYYQVARPKVDELSARIEQKVWCVTEEQGRGVRIYVSNYNKKLETKAYIGQRTYLHQSANGKAILAYLPRERVEKIIDQYGLPAATKQTITDRDELFKELERIRERGFAINRGESVWRLTGIGAPVRDKNGNVLGSLSVATASNLLKEERLETEIAEQLLSTINEIEINLTNV